MRYYTLVDTKEKYEYLMKAYENREFKWVSGKKLREREFGSRVFEDIVCIKEDEREFATRWNEISSIEYLKKLGYKSFKYKNTNKNKYIGG